VLSITDLSVVGQTLQTRVAPDKSVAKIKAKVEKIDVRADLTIGMANRRTHQGFGTKIDDDSFEITEVDLNAMLTIRYEVVKSIESGYSEKGPLGDRVG